MVEGPFKKVSFEVHRRRTAPGPAASPKGQPKRDGHGEGYHLTCERAARSNATREQRAPPEQQKQALF